MRWPAQLHTHFRLLQVYYFGTPIFVLLDLMFATNIRVAALEHTPVLKYGYYIVCLGCGFLTWTVPQLAAVVALIESSVNLLLLMLGVLLPYYQLVEQLISGQAVATAGFTPALVINFAISATIWTVSFYRNPLLSGPQRRDAGPR